MSNQTPPMPDKTPDCIAADCKHKMRTRCTECGREQYGIGVWHISHGKEPCLWCGKFNVVEEEV